MRGNSRRARLDRQLQTDRPQPRDEFVSGLAERLVAEPIRRSAGWRVAFAAGFSAVLVVAFALTGGIVYAADAVQGGTTAVTSLVTGPSKVHRTKGADARGQTSGATHEASSTTATQTLSSSSTTQTSSSTSAPVELSSPSATQVLSSSNDEESGSGDDEEPNGDDEEDDDSSADDQYEDDVLICHRRPNGETRTIEVDADEVDTHLAHGDALGPCPDDDDDEEDDD